MYRLARESQEAVKIRTRLRHDELHVASLTSKTRARDFSALSCCFVNPLLESILAHGVTDSGLWFFPLTMRPALPSLF